jgi:hypothetical protein
MKAVHDMLGKKSTSRSHPKPVHACLLLGAKYALKMTACASHAHQSIRPGRGAMSFGVWSFSQRASCRDRDTGARPGKSHEAQLGLQIKGATGEHRGILYNSSSSLKGRAMIAARTSQIILPNFPRMHVLDAFRDYFLNQGFIVTSCMQPAGV